MESDSSYPINENILRVDFARWLQKRIPAYPEFKNRIDRVLRYPMEHLHGFCRVHACGLDVVALALHDYKDGTLLWKLEQFLIEFDRSVEINVKISRPGSGQTLKPGSHQNNA